MNCLKDHILTETVAKHNGILEHCMYCNNKFKDNAWRITRKFLQNYITTTCSECGREHRFSDDKIHTIEDLVKN